MHGRACCDDLAVSLKAVISQRLIKSADGSLIAAAEVLLNSKHIADSSSKARPIK